MLVPDFKQVGGVGLGWELFPKKQCKRIEVTTDTANPVHWVPIIVL